MTSTALTNGRLADGRAVDVLIEGGVITKVSETDAGFGSEGAETIDLEGRLLVPAFGEPHAHLDKAYLADLVPNPAGDLVSAVEAIRAAWPRFDVSDIATRAATAARNLVASGTTAIRTHVDLSPEGGEKSVKALREVRDELSDICDLQLSPLSYPVTGPEGPEGRKLLSTALNLGVQVVGSCPHLDDDPVEAIEIALAAAAENDLPVDLHFDEVLDASVQHLPELARLVEARGLGGRVTASHCVSHGLLPPDRQREIGRMLADAGVAVVVNPRTNLFLQARGVETAPPRGIAGTRALLDEGVTVAAGADNLQDPFYIVGRPDPLETATFLVTAAHLTIDEAWELVGPAVRLVMNLPEVTVSEGSPAELVALEARSLREAVADQPPARLVFHNGRLVARTTIDRWVA